MQASINEMIEKNKYTFNLISDKINEVHANAESDLNNIVDINNRLPAVLSSHDKMELAKLLNTMELRLKSFDSDATEVEHHVNELEFNTNSFIDSLGVSIKGAPLASKNTLIHNAIEQISSLKEGNIVIKELVIKLDKLIDDLKELTGLDEKRNLKTKKVIKELINNEVEQVKNLLKVHVDSLIGNALNNNKEPDNNKWSIDNLKTLVEGELGKMSYDLEKIKSDFEFLRDGVHAAKSNVKEMHSNFSDQINDIKHEVGLRIKNFENSLNTNVIKRYI
jgi:methyl-accepting chemotaxis protein